MRPPKSYQVLHNFYANGFWWLSFLETKAKAGCLCSMPLMWSVRAQPSLPGEPCCVKAHVWGRQSQRWLLSCHEKGVRGGPAYSFPIDPRRLLWRPGSQRCWEHKAGHSWAAELPGCVLTPRSLVVMAGPGMPRWPVKYYLGCVCECVSGGNIWISSLNGEEALPSAGGPPWACWRSQ